MTVELARRFIGDKAGATAVEYAILVSLIAAAIILSLAAVTGRLTGVFDEVSFDPGVSLHSGPTP